MRFLLGLFGAAVVLLSAYLLFRPPKHTRFLDAADEAQVRTLLRDFGDHDSLGYFATRRDKSVVWDTGDPATARAGVSYRGGRLGQPGQRQPGRRPGALARGDRGLAAAGPSQRSVAGRDGSRRGRRGSVHRVRT